MGERLGTQTQEGPRTGRRALLTGGAAGLVAVAGATLGRTQPAGAATVRSSILGQPSVTDWVNVVNMGADPTGLKDSTKAFLAAVAALPTMTLNEAIAPVGVVYVPTGTYTVSGTIPLPANARLVGTGGGSQISFTGSGDAIRQYNQVGPAYPAVMPGGGVEDLVIDGANAQAGSCGLHIGNGTDYLLSRLRISNFNGANCIGLHLDNVLNNMGKDGYTEKMTAEVQLYNNTVAVLIENTGGTKKPSQLPSGNSFMYNDFDFHIWAEVGQQGIVLQNGAYIANARLKVRGNFFGAGGAALTIQGQDGSGNASFIGRTLFDIAVETDNGGTWTTIVFGSTANSIRESSGQLIFSDGWRPATVGSAPTPPGVNVAVTTQQFAFAGVVCGDPNLNGINGPAGSLQVTSGRPVIYPANVFDNSTGNLFDGFGDFFETTLTGNMTVSLGQGGGSVKGPQRKNILIVQAASGGYTVTWPPAVKWPGGAAPVMTSTANAVDMYELVTMDGQTWYGWAIQNLE
ncbi:MAG TPA: glycosyl hydrolase family 28-related protein [Streptosporangiaceae bacterium]|nr:glycosyl hydrolase family 28-related protein [Streptosporangiaceae bacterium]